EKFWTGGITNPLTVIEQISYLMFARMLDMQEDVAERKALLQRLAAVRGRLSLCADQAAAAKWWLSMPMASVSA
ncbi:type I restriction-modification system subunit M N-terminal domain-containing protein, partial [Pseudomonas aeruginosa]|uniref:type I restriction-modification system subunit M N-terminal domain-containing protein n=1 Tax=Pseudomonas aeruginosa TaxID=287 RepID=UPI003714BDA6